MQKFTLIALLLSSSSAFATSSRTAALSGNGGITDDTDFMTYASRTDESDSVWLDYSGALSGAGAWGGSAVTIAGGDGVLGVGWYNDGGDTGYSASLGLNEADHSLAVGGSYSMTDGGSDMAVGGGVVSGEDAAGDSTLSVAVGVSSRDLTDDAATLWGAGLTYDDVGIGLGGSYAMGNRFGADNSTGAFTYGPSLGVDMPSEGDMALDLNLVDMNLGGEFAITDWFGLRGSVTASIGLEEVATDADMYVSAGAGSAFGAGFSADGCNIDVTVDPANLLGMPHFLTGVESDGFAAMMSARFDI